MFLERRSRRPLRLSRCSHAVMLRPSKPTVGEVPTGGWGSGVQRRRRVHHRERKGETDAAHNGLIGYARTGRKGPGEKQFVFSTARHACAICIYDIDKNFDIIE
jgi:hypothetical protein